MCFDTQRALNRWFQRIFWPRSHFEPKFNTVKTRASFKTTFKTNTCLKVGTLLTTPVLRSEHRWQLTTENKLWHNWKQTLTQTLTTWRGKMVLFLQPANNDVLFWLQKIQEIQQRMLLTAICWLRSTFSFFLTTDTCCPRHNLSQRESQRIYLRRLFAAGKEEATPMRRQRTYLRPTKRETTEWRLLFAACSLLSAP